MVNSNRLLLAFSLPFLTVSSTIGQELWSANGDGMYYNNANVGIGTNSSPGFLHIKASSGSAQLRVEPTFQNSAVLSFQETWQYSENLWRPILGWDAANSRFSILNNSSGVIIVPLDYNGKLGIGSWNSPSYKLDVTGDGRFCSSLRALDFRSVSGHFAAGLSSGNIRLGSDYSTHGLDFYAGASKRFGISSNGDSKLDGNLIVNDEIETTKVTVTASAGSFPDYVFSKNYKLNTLTEIEEFIQENGHLPNMPTAKEVEANGQDLVLIQQKLLEKIEELTLYVIELKKENVQQQKEIEELKEEQNEN
ncbi:hypothetical protein [uncultured Roseivirga sp.]|uniref:hypothetical protein n=1 Tax=uncultured Roseivirga sp. TaxID=543088 RepID=UPI000D791F3A|nr:hypothetical protein [uncultured Roseivirga sp.]PWL28956.1 MAG: hypothetical protein DCO95_10955 [Roseivirga sp. XM-24bin3]